MTRLYNLLEQKSLRKRLRSTLPKSEAMLWKRLKGSQMGYKFRRQHGIGRFVLDLYCPAVRLGVEIDGLSHEDESQYQRDLRRQEFLESLGIQILRFSSEEVFQDIDRVFENIINACGARAHNNDHP